MLVTCRTEACAPLRPGLTAISLAQPPKNASLWTQCPAVRTVLGPDEPARPDRAGAARPAHLESADHPPRRQLGVEDADAVVLTEHALEPRPAAGARGSGPLLPLPTRCRSEREGSAALPGWPGVVRDGTAASVAIDSSPVARGSGLRTDFSWIMRPLLPG